MGTETRLRPFSKKRKFQGNYMMMLSVIMTLLLSCSILVRSDEVTSPYEWENWDYYKILGLEDSKDFNKIDAKDIRKAYRKQAQMYHPDKLIHANHKNMTVEESNARFNRIAEAYQVLQNDDQREQYNEFLRIRQRQQNQQNPQQSTRGTASSSSYSDMFWDYVGTWDNSIYDYFRGWDGTSTREWDARKMFEDFFSSVEDFFSDDDDNESYSNDGRKTFTKEEDIYNEFSHGGNGNSYSAPQDQFSSPNRIIRSQEVWLDPRSGLEILRALETEEYDLDSSTIYYRVWGQDFVDTWDRYQRRWVYQPIQLQAFLVTEGYRDVDETSFSNREGQQHSQRKHYQRSQAEESHFNQYQQEMPFHNNKPFPYQAQFEDFFEENDDDDNENYLFDPNDPSILLPGEGLVPHGGKVVLQNGNIVAAISNLCNLKIGIITSDGDSSIKEIWSSDTAFYGTKNHCELKLHGPHLTISAFSSAQSGHSSGREQLLWYSDVSDEYIIPKEASYVAKLDSDGILVVYEQKKLTAWMLRAWNQNIVSLPILKRMWRKLLQTIIGRVVAIRNESTILRKGQIEFKRWTCVSAVGSPAGCNRIKRSIRRIAFQIGTSMERMKKISV